MYYIIELQTGDTASALPQAREGRQEALSVYHSIMSSAATSNVEYHACMVVDEKGQYIARECYEHPRIEEGETDAEV